MFRWDSLIHFVQPAGESDRSALLGPSQEGSDGETYKVGQGVTPPRPVSSPDPNYPKLPKGSPKQGVVVLKLVVDEKGLPRDIQIFRSLTPEFDRAAIEAVEKWTFVPSTKDGRPVRVQINVEVSFQR
jgi:protein TonB